MIILFLFACATVAPTDLPTNPVTVTAFVASASGGRIALDDGAWVEIGPDVLAADGDVHFSRTTCEGVYRAEVLASCRYDVQSEIPFVGRYTVGLPRSSDKANIIADAGSGWTPRIDSRHDHEQVLASSSMPAAFSSLTVQPVGCDDPPFTPCGGDLVGVWDVEMPCVTLEQLGIITTGPDPYDACDPHDHLHSELTSISGSITFETSGDWHETDSIQSDELRIMADTCLDIVGHACAGPCTSDNGVCTCLTNQFESVGTSVGTWEPGSGDTVRINGQEIAYCVDGDALTLRWGHGSRYMVYRRR